MLLLAFLSLLLPDFADPLGTSPLTGGPPEPRQLWALGLLQEARRAGWTGQVLASLLLRCSVLRRPLRSVPCALAGGRFSPLPVTLCRRSPALGRGAAAAVGPWAGFCARVGERGGPGPSDPGNPRVGDGGRVRTPGLSAPLP